MAESSTSGFHLFSNSKAQPLGSTFVGFLYCQSPRKRISFAINHSAASLSRGCPGGTPPRWPCPTPARGTVRGARCSLFRARAFSTLVVPVGREDDRPDNPGP